MALCAEMVPADQLRDMLTEIIPMPRFELQFPEPGEVNPWEAVLWLGYGEGDDGGGAAVAAIRYGRCPFVH